HGPTASGSATRLLGTADTAQFFFGQTCLGGTSGSATSVMPGGTGQSITPKFAEYSSILSSHSGGKTRAYGSTLVTPAPVKLSGLTFNHAANSISRPSGNWAADGFVAGQTIQVTGTAN